MSEWKGKSRGGLLGYKIFVSILKTFGLGAAYTLLAFVAFYFIPFAPKATRFSYLYFRKIQKYGVFKSIISLYLNYYIFGQTLIDRVAVMAGVPTKLTFNFDGEHHLIKLADEKKGAVLISAHCGNWEIAGHFFHHVGSKINIIMYDEEHQRIKQFLETVQTNKSLNENVHIIPLKDDLSHVVALNNAVQNGEFIVLHGDRFREGTKAFEFEFMGQKAMFPTGPFYIATKYKLPVSFVFAFKEGRNHYHLFATPGKVYELKGNPEERNEGLRILIQDYITAVEAKVKAYPLQWFNYFQFWKEIS